MKNLILNSNIFDKESSLPLFPNYNNPWLYMAVTIKLLKLYEQRFIHPDKVFDYYRECLIEPGLFSRWNDGTGGLNSYDELIGASYLHPAIAKDIMLYLKKHIGEYNNLEVEIPFYRCNMFRFPFAMAYIWSRANNKNSLLNLFWALAAITSSTKEIGSSQLKIWIMSDEMMKYKICRWAYKIFKKRMLKAGITLRMCIKRELQEPLLYSSLMEDF